MLHNLIDLWKQTLPDLNKHIDPDSKDMNKWASHSSIHFSTPPRIVFVDNFEKYDIIRHYNQLKSPPLSPEDEARFAEASVSYDLEVKAALDQQRKPPFYNGDNILCAGLAFDPYKNTLFIQAYRISYWFIRAMQNKVFAETSDVYQRHYYTLGVHVPLITQDGYTYFMQRANPATPFYATVAGFLEVKAGSSFTHLFQQTAKEELLEELLGNPKKPRVGFYSEGLSAINFVEAKLAGRNYKVIDFVFATHLECDDERMRYILNHNVAIDAKEHTHNFFRVNIKPGKVPAVFLLQKERPGTTYYHSEGAEVQPDAPGIFSYGAPLAAAALAVAKPPHLPKCLPGTHARMFQIPKESLTKSLLSEEEKQQLRHVRAPGKPA